MAKQLDLFEKTSVSTEQFAEQTKRILKEVHEIVVAKNREYGASSMELGPVGNYVHLFDKVKRIKQMLEKRYRGEEAKFESLEDSYRDIIGYALLGLVILESLHYHDPEVGFPPPTGIVPTVQWDNSPNPLAQIAEELKETNSALLKTSSVEENHKYFSNLLLSYLESEERFATTLVSDLFFFLNLNSKKSFQKRVYTVLVRELSDLLETM